MLNIAVIGAGNWGRNLVRNFSLVSRARLHTICDVHERVREEMSSLHPGVNLTSSFDAVLSSGNDIGAVVIASPATQHYEMASAALKAGKHTYVEKPLCLDKEEARALCDLAAERELKLMVGHLLVYHPAVRKLKEVVDAGDLGDVYCIYTERVNLGIIRKNENAWWSLAPHDISVVLELLNEMPDSITVRGESYLQKDVEDIVFASLHFPSKRMAQIHVSWLDPNKSRKMTIVGSKKMAVFDDMRPEGKLSIYDKGVEIRDYVSYQESIAIRNGEEYLPDYDMVEPLAAECQHFVDCIVEDWVPRSSGTEGLKVTSVLSAGEESLNREGEPVSIGGVE